MSTAYPGPNNDSNQRGGTSPRPNPYLSQQQGHAQPGQPAHPGNTGQPQSSYHRQVNQGGPYQGGQFTQPVQQYPFQGAQQPHQGSEQNFAAGPNGPDFGYQQSQQVPGYQVRPGAPNPYAQVGTKKSNNGLITAIAVIGLLAALGLLAAVLLLTGGDDADSSASATSAPTSAIAPGIGGAAGKETEPSTAPSSQASTGAASGAGSNEDALEAAQMYVDAGGVSKRNLKSLLGNTTYGHGYTQEAIDYALDNVDVDWNEEALEAAKELRDIPDTSDEELRSYLSIAAGFTDEEIDYALSKL